MSLPTLVPSTAAVEAAAQRFAREADPSFVSDPDKWENSPPYVKNWYTARALDIITAAGPHLIADVVEYLVSNHKRFAFTASTTDQLIDTVMETRGACDPSYGGLFT